MLVITKKLHYEMPAHKVIHIAKSLKTQPHEPKLVKEYAFANATKRKENKGRVGKGELHP